MVEAAGIEPASEAASPGISTSVFRILVLASRLLPTGSVSASRGGCPASGPRRPRSGNPVYVTPFSSPPDWPETTPGIMSRGSRPYCLRSEGESGVLVGVCKRCAV